MIKKWKYETELICSWDSEVWWMLFITSIILLDYCAIALLFLIALLFGGVRRCLAESDTRCIYYNCVHWPYTRYSVHCTPSCLTNFNVHTRWYDMVILESRSVSRSGDRTLTVWTIIRSHVNQTRCIGEVLVEMMIYSMSQWLMNSMNISLTKHLLSMSPRFETIVTQLQHILVRLNAFTERRYLKHLW